MTQTVNRRAFKPGTAGRAAAWSPARVRRSATAEARRPFGIGLLSVAAAAIGVAMLLWAGTWLVASDIVAGSGLETAARVIVPTLLMLAALESVLAYGVWRLRSWAWPLGVGLTIAALVLTELSAGRGSSEAHTVSLLLEVGTLWYLLSPRVHEALQNRAR